MQPVIKLIHRLFHCLQCFNVLHTCLPTHTLWLFLCFQEGTTEIYPALTLVDLVVLLLNTHVHCSFITDDCFSCWNHTGCRKRDVQPSLVHVQSCVSSVTHTQLHSHTVSPTWVWSWESMWGQRPACEALRYRLRCVGAWGAGSVNVLMDL